MLLHNTRDDCWIIVRNNVYNITGFIADHPGGADILLTRAGEDATSYFVTKHGNNPAVQKQLERYKIGELIAGERITADDFNEPFLMELIDRCYKEKLYQQPHWATNPVFWVRLMGGIIFFALSLTVLYAGTPWWIALILVIMQAFIGTSLFGLIAHEATHRNFPKHPLSKILLRISWPIFWPFISQGPLRYEHNSHHIKIGDPEFDYEVAAFAPLVRYSGHIEHNSFHRFQHHLARYLYPFYANFITTIGGIFSGFWKRHRRLVKFEHAFSLTTTLAYYILIPYIITGSFWLAIVLYLVYQCTLFYGIYVGAAINHFVPQVAVPVPDEHKNKYGYYNCHHTTNFGTYNRFWYWYTGGFNLQIEHHLIPFVPVDNLPKMVPIVQELCKKYNYPYHNYTTFRELWKDHYGYLYTLSTGHVNEEISVEIANKSTYQGR